MIKPGFSSSDSTRLKNAVCAAFHARSRRNPRQKAMYGLNEFFRRMQTDAGNKGFGSREARDCIREERSKKVRAVQ